MTSTVSCNSSRARRPSPSPRLRGEGRGEGQRQTPTPELVAAPHPNPLPTEEWGEGIRAALAAAVCVLIAWLLPTLALAQSSAPLAVEVSNASEPVLCAEKDNVTVNFASPDVRRFRIEAAHPAYIGAIQNDSFEADWTGCTAPGDPKAAPAQAPPQPPKRTTLYEQIDMWVVGLTFPSFWRPATATVRIGDRVEKGLHLLQVWMIRPMGGEEVAVLYPQDGYWRLRPLALCRQGADGVRLLVPDRAGGGRRAADRADQGGRVRPALAHFHAAIRARRDRAREDGGHRSKPECARHLV